MDRVSIAYVLYISVAPVLVCAQSELAGPHPIRLSGKVLDPTGDAVLYEAVALRIPALLNVVARVQTDGRGIFTFPAALPGKFVLSVQTPGYRSFSQLIDVTGANDIDVGTIGLEITDADVTNYPWSWIKPSRSRLGGSRQLEISGRVVDKQGMPIHEALVSIPGWFRGREETADQDGAFAFLRVPLSEIKYWLTVKAWGFDTAYFGPFKVKKDQKTIDVGNIVMKMFAPN
jgi:hypothetical protein